MKSALDAAVFRWFNEVAAHGVFTTDIELRIHSWNRWLELHTGQTASEVIGRPLTEVLPELEKRGFIPYYTEALRGQVRVISQALHGHVLTMRARLGNRTMPEMPQTGRIGPLTEDDRVVGTITIIEDVTERTVRETELRNRIDQLDEARRQAEAAMLAKDQFLATLSHELRTPLTAVIGWTRILRRGPSDPAQTARALEVIDRNAASQVRLIDDLLDMSRILAGKLRIDVKPVDLAAVVSAAVDVSAPAASAKGVELKLKMVPRLPFVGDADRLQQIVWNLVSNAVKFTPEGGVIEVELFVKEGMGVLRVRDTGEGIAPEFLPHVFQRFRQADPSTMRRHGGLGIGLSLVRELVELHGGFVVAESPGLGLGATLSVQFPLRTHALNGPVSTGGDARLQEGARLENIAVVVVDDEPDTREMLRTLLAAEGADVTVAGSCDDALVALAHRSLGNASRVILSDLAMPGDDGYVLLERLRDHPAVRDTSVIALTAYATAEERKRALDAGFAAYLTKPVDLDTLTATIVAVVERSDRRARK